MCTLCENRDKEMKKYLIKAVLLGCLINFPIQSNAEDLRSLQKNIKGFCADTTNNLLMHFSRLGGYDYLFNPKRKSYLFTFATNGTLMREASDLEKELFNVVYNNMQEKMDLYALIGGHSSDSKKCLDSSIYCLQPKFADLIVDLNVVGCDSVFIERYIN